MSLCRTCEYALYDGMCMAHGRLTLLDAPACDDYKMHLDVEVSKLKAENAKLRERVAELEELEDGKRYIPQEWYQLVTTENAKLRELLRQAIYARDDADWASIVSTAIALGVEVRP